jgi:glucokinase
MTQKEILLIGDIGGTNARFALADNEQPGFSHDMTLQCADFASADLAITHYLRAIGAASPDVICLAAAGPVVEERVRFTNNPWSIASADLGNQFATPKRRLLNDFEAIAYSFPYLTGKDRLPIGLSKRAPVDAEHYTIGILGPGTGLGAVGLRKHGDLLIPIAGEASHGGFAPESQLQIEMLSALRERYDRVSAERFVSGPGIENIYWAMCRIHAEERPQLTAAEIFDRAADSSDPRAAESVQVFFEILGQVAGDYALALGANDGIFIAGGIARRYPELLMNSRFRSGFESKGRYRSLMEQVPTELILHEQPGLLGAAYCALELARS